MTTVYRTAAPIRYDNGMTTFRDAGLFKLDSTRLDSARLGSTGPEGHHSRVQAYGAHGPHGPQQHSGRGRELPSMIRIRWPAHPMGIVVDPGTGLDNVCPQRGNALRKGEESRRPSFRSSIRTVAISSIGSSSSSRSDPNS